MRSNASLVSRWKRSARSTLVSAESSSAGRFLPYGTPCSEIFDPATQKLEILQCEEFLSGEYSTTFLEERMAVVS